jgi:purine-nucleoside phosphorylase
MLNKIQESVEYILSQIKKKPEIALILGTGLGDFAKSVEVKVTIPYAQIPHFPSTTVDGHAGELIYASHQGKDILVMRGRIHFYEGLPMEAITFPVRVMKFLGVHTLILSNASGGINEKFKVGDLMILSDHINLMPNPLIGRHYSEFGERFPDMSEAYSKALISLGHQIARENNIKIHEGVYLSVSGPTYETPAEYKFFHIIGADAVGMSTVPEVIVARQMGMDCFAISVITDLGVPGKIEYMTHEMVQEAAAQAEPKMTTIVNNLIKKI